jgi:hypothetical protein
MSRPFIPRNDIDQTSLSSRWEMPIAARSYIVGAKGGDGEEGIRSVLRQRSYSSLKYPVVLS